MKTASFNVLSQDEVERISNASMEVLAEVGIKVSYQKARDIFRENGAQVDDETFAVRLPEDVLRRAIEQAPASFSLYGRDPSFELKISSQQTEPVFAGLGTPTRIIDDETRKIRETTKKDMIDHIILIDHAKNIHGCQMDVWPNDILMTTIHTEAIWAWAHNSHKSFGMGCYGYLPTWDMMRMMAIAVGGKEELQKHPRFMGICSVVSPLQMDQAQAEGALICAEYGQPIAMSPEGIAGATTPVTLAGLLVQENASILAHIALVQMFRPGAPVLYGTVSTAANMRYGTVALGSPETGLITAASAQLARHYGLPIRSVGGATDAKRPDIQAGVERLGTLLPAVLSGVNLITCAGTLDGTMMEDNALLVLDDEICEAALRMQRGIEVNDTTMALDVIKKVGFDSNYITESHTAKNYRNELFMPSLYSREPFEAWQKAGEPLAMDHARARVKKTLEEHQPYEIDADIEKDLDAFLHSVSARALEDFYLFEQADRQDYENL